MEITLLNKEMYVGFCRGGWFCFLFFVWNPNREHLLSLLIYIPLYKRFVCKNVLKQTHRQTYTHTSTDTLFNTCSHTA